MYKMYTFCDVLHAKKQKNKKHKQTFENVQYCLKSSLKWFKSNNILYFSNALANV